MLRTMGPFTYAQDPRELKLASSLSPNWNRMNNGEEKVQLKQRKCNIILLDFAIVKSKTKKPEHEICFTDCALVQFYHLPSALKLVSCKFWLIRPLNAVYWSCKEKILMFGATHMALTSLRPCLDSTGTSSSLGCGQIFWNLVTHGKCWKNLENRTDRCLAAWNFNTVGLILLKCEANKSWLALRIRLEATNSSKPLPEPFRSWSKTVREAASSLG